MQRLGRIIGNVFSRHETKRTVEVKLVDVCRKVANVTDIGSHMVLGTGVEALLISEIGGSNTWVI